MTCYQRHLMPMFESLGLPYEKDERRRVDTALRQVLGVDDAAHCPEVWAAIKALPADERDRLAERVAELI